jgi:transposase InsO family protein
VSAKTVREWRDRSARPLRSPRRLPPEPTAQIEALRRQRRSGPASARELGLAGATVGLVPRRLGLNSLKALDPKPGIIRDEREHPGELIRIDIKTLGRIAGDCHGQSGKRGTGWEYLHVAIDDASRLAFTAMMPDEKPDEKKESAVAFLDAAIAWFRVHAVVVQRVMTDHGSAYRSAVFARAVATHGLKRKRTGPYTPKTNTLHPDQHPRMGLWHAFPDLRRARPRDAPMAARPQHRPTSLSPQGKAAHQPHREGQCPWQ